MSQIQFNHSTSLRGGQLPTPDAIDFPVAPCWVRHYSELGLTQDYPAEFYLPDMSTLKQQVKDLEEQIKDLRTEVQGRKVIYRYKHILLADKAGAKKPKHTGGIDL